MIGNGFLSMHPHPRNSPPFHNPSHRISSLLFITNHRTNDSATESFIHSTNHEPITSSHAPKSFTIPESSTLLPLLMPHTNHPSLPNHSSSIITPPLPHPNPSISPLSPSPTQSPSTLTKPGLVINSTEGSAQTIPLGFSLLILQSKESPSPLLTPTDSPVGSTIYFTTGSHGSHVTTGSSLPLSHPHHLSFSIPVPQSK